MKKKAGIGLVMTIILVLFYFLFWPASPRPVGSFVAPQSPSLTSVYEANNSLQAVERFGEGYCLGPEDIAVDTQGRIYAGMADGRIIRLAKDSHSAELIANTGGRPSGMAFDVAGNLIVADSEQGLLLITPKGVITLLTNGASGQPIRLANDLDIAEDGMIYFSDYRHYPDYVSDFMDGRPLTRLLVYDPRTRITQVLLDDLYAANGVTLGPDDAFVLVNEMTAYRVIRYWLTGPKKGQTDIFIENLPGFPDNITFNGRDIYWLALFTPRSSVMEFLQARPILRGILKPGPLLLVTSIVNTRKYGFVLGLDLEGKIVHNLQDTSGNFASQVTSAYEDEGMLYLGNLSDKAVYRIPTP